MSMFNKGMEISKGQKYDLTQVSTEGLSAEDIEKMDKKARKLIDIYNTDGKAGLSQIELARAMDEIYFDADKNKDGKLSNKELDEYAKKFNEERGLTGDAAVKGNDFKSLLKGIRKMTKGDEKASTAETIDDAVISDWAKENGFEAVDGHHDVYQKDCKYTMIVRGDELLPVRAKLDGDKYRKMTDKELKAEQAQELQAEIDKKAQEGGYVLADEEAGVYSKANTDGFFIYDDAKKDFVRAKHTDNDEYVAMTPEEIEAEDAEFAQFRKEALEEEQRRQELETPKAYTVQNGESLTSILKRSLEAQGKEVTKESLAEAKAEFIKNNPKALHGARGREYLYAGDVVKVAGNLEDKANAGEIKATEQQRQQRVRQQREEAAARAAEEKAAQEKAANQPKEEWVDFTSGRHKKTVTQKNGDVSISLYTADKKSVYNNPGFVAERLGFKKASFGQSTYYDASAKQYYRWDSSTNSFTKTSADRYNIPPLKFDSNGKSVGNNKGFVLNSDGSVTKKMPDGNTVKYTFYPSGRPKKIEFKIKQKTGYVSTVTYDYKDRTSGHVAAGGKMKETKYYCSHTSGYTIAVTDLYPNFKYEDNVLI